MSEVNPLILVDTLKKTLRRYISTTLPINRRYRNLQKKFVKLVKKQILVKGPYVEALPDFEKGKSIRKLLSISGGFLHDGFKNLPNELLDRKLHRHQEKSLYSACLENAGLIVATGTGSGKTETFLYPIAHKLMGEKNPDAAGVRALLVYPMNALANDQLFYRIAPLFGNYLKNYNITFGRYTGQVKAHSSRQEEEYKLKDNEKLMSVVENSIPENWLLTREEMIENPPKILITNYAMLEHLLLLPRNAPLFIHNTLHTIVLDEIHTYNGAQATEVAILLRKLKNRLGINRNLQVYGTSASLAPGSESDVSLLDFACNLFGEKVHEVIRGQRIPHARIFEKGKEFSLSLIEWIKIGDILNECITESYDSHDWNQLIKVKKINEKLPGLDENKKLPNALEEVFRSNVEIRKVAEVLNQKEIVPFQELAKIVFSDKQIQKDEQYSALSALMHLGMLACISDDSFPLLPSRYHIITNGIEGVCVSLEPNNEEGWDEIKPFRNFTDQKGRPFFPLLVCRRCGQPYIEGFSDQETLYNTLKETDFSKTKFTRKIYLLGKLIKSSTLDEVDESTTIGDDENKFVYIDPETGKISDDERNGKNVKLLEVDTIRDEIERNDYVRTCKACGSQATGALSEIISHMHTGNEAFSSVVTQKVLEALPGEKDFYEPKPMMGRSLLTFSDSRQNAAYFAPYFERTSKDMALRTAIIRVLKKEKDTLNLGDLSDLVLKYWKKFGQPVILGSSGEIIESNTKKTDHVLGSVAAEFCTPGGRRNSLEALGLVKVTYHKRLINKLIRAVNDFAPESKIINIEDLSHILLETIRREKAIANLYDIDMSDPFIWGEIYKRHRSFELYKANPKISNAWLTQEGRKQHNRRTWFFIERLKWSSNESREFLSNFWQALLDLKILINTHPGFGLDAKLIRIAPGANYNLYYCKDCGLSIFDVVDNCCTAFRCRGNTQLISEEDREIERHRNHYIYNIENGRALTIRAREHTASLSTDLRQKIEQEFNERKINVLSCTTTMEMGVDLGELEAVMCLNIPPGITNYQQRTGRAGRRAQAAPFCVTTARNSQYDQAVFRNFRDYLEKPAPIPRIHLENAKLFQRHQNSIILSGFLKHKILDLSINAPSISDLFGIEFYEEKYNNFMDIIYNWIESDDGKAKIAEAENLALKLPNGMENRIALKGNALKQQFIKQLMMLAIDVKERWDLYSNKMKSFAELKDYKKAAHWDNMRSKYMKQFLVSQLSFYGMIPTYSFPVNSLNLEVTREYGMKNVYSGEKDISLSRDAILGIAEYAPGAEIVANGRIWSSQGLAYYPRDFMPTRFYTYCQECQHVEVSEDKIDLPNSCTFCGNQHIGLKRNFIEPKGFVTAYKDRKGKDPARYRVRKQFADEARLISLAKDDDFILSDHPFISKALLRSHSINKDLPIGTLFVVNRGPFGMGYHRCSLCNYMIPAKKAELKTQKHTELLGDIKCHNEKLTWPIDIAHIFNTDICILRFNKRIPILKNETTKSEHRRYINSFARTMSETLRFAATTVLNLNLDVLRATHKINDGHLSIIIFDSVPGGAGYSVRLFNEAKVHDIINAAINRLDCSNNCSSGCRTCLCDYSNQKAWDLFERKPVLDWLKLISRHDAEQPIIKAGGKEWKNPSYSGLTEKLSQYDHLYILGRTLLTKHSTYDGNAVRWLIERLNADNRVHILLTEKLDIDSFRTHQERLIINYLKPYIENQQLLIGNIDYEGTFTKIPRLIVQPLRGLPAFFTNYAIPAILDQVLPPPIYEFTLDNKITDRINKLLDSKSIYDPQILFPPDKKMIRWSLHAGSPRKYDEYFSELKDKYVEKLVIKDPYCGSGDRQIRALQEFIKLLKRQIKQLKKVDIYCKELSYRHPNYRSSVAVRNEIIESLKQIITIEPNVKIIDFSYGRNFHDRSVVASTINEDGETSTHIYDLSGGIDFLMDEKKETKIFYSQEIKN